MPSKKWNRFIKHNKPNTKKIGRFISEHNKNFEDRWQELHEE